MNVTVAAAVAAFTVTRDGHDHRGLGARAPGHWQASGHGSLAGCPAELVAGTGGPGPNPSPTADAPQPRRRPVLRLRLVTSSSLRAARARAAQ